MGFENIMEFGLIRVGSATPKIKVADSIYNTNKVIELMEEAHKNLVKVLVFPELCITSSTCGDLFRQDILGQFTTNHVVERFMNETTDFDVIAFIGTVFLWKNRLYNVALIVYKGKILGIVPKMSLDSEEMRYFSRPDSKEIYIDIDGEKVVFGPNVLISHKEFPDLIIGVVFSQDFLMPMSNAFNHCLAGANLIVNLSSSESVVGSREKFNNYIMAESGRLMCSYIYAGAGEGESTTDKVFIPLNLIAENGHIINSKNRSIDCSHLNYTEIDLGIINSNRKMKNYYENYESYKKEYIYIDINSKDRVNQVKQSDDYGTVDIENRGLIRHINKSPFIPMDLKKLKARCTEIITLQTVGLKKRLEHINGKDVVIGISGGLDSTLALLIVKKTFDDLGLDSKGIHTITMPCFGTTSRTYNNSVSLSKILDTNFKEINIKEAVEIHFRDIGHNMKEHDITYENSQARERTQILMDIANIVNGLVIGTGDMSELALGWATYNGDHMSMYAVNSSIPKTLVRHLVEFFAKEAKGELKKILYDILDTPVSPELIPPKEGEIAQKTEEIVGPYELHDFFMYYLLRYGFTPKKIKYLAEVAFKNEYDKEIINKWINIFYKRFFSQQFKRSCFPDGPKVGSLSLSPRGEWIMPSDGMGTIWLSNI